MCEVAKITQFKKLKGISVDRNKIREGAVHIATLVGNTCKTLTELSCVNNEIAPLEFNSIFKNLKKCDKLEKLVFNDNKINRSDQKQY